ncbi:MAG TPA: carbohydrate binding domain-containing protein [Candidatus Saccharimonadales bacterium]
MLRRYMPLAARRCKVRFAVVAPILVGLFACVVAVVGASVPTVSAAQTVPYKVNFQGRLTNTAGNTMPDGLYNMKFRLWTALAAGSNPWTEVREAGSRVQVTNGIFSVQLGDVTGLTPSMFTTQPLYFEIELPTPATATCSGASCAVYDGNEVMTPRRPLGASPYAMNADTVDGIDGSSLAQLSPSGAQTGSLNVTGNITSGGSLQGNTLDAATSGLLSIGGTNATGITLADSATMGSGLSLSLQGSSALSLGSTSAAGGIVFRDGTANNRSVTLSSVGLTGSYTLSMPAAGATGVTCLKSSSGSTSSATALEFGACAGGGVTLQGGTPGTADVGSINVNGTGIFGTALKSPTLDAAAAGALGIGGTTATSITLGKTSGTTSITTTVHGTAVFKNNADSTTAFQIQNAAGTSNLFVADTDNSRIGIGGAATDSKLTIVDNGTIATNNTATDRNSLLRLQADDDSPYGLVFGNSAYHASNGYAMYMNATGALNFTDPQGADVMTLSSTGAATFGNRVDSANGFLVQNASGTKVLSIDTASNNSNNLLINPSFEATLGTTWTARGTAAPVQDATQFHNGSYSLRLPNVAANDGAKQVVALTSATTYTLSFYARATPGTSDFATFAFGRADNGSTDTACRTAVTVSKNGWSRYTCSFTTGTVSGSPYIYVKQTDAVARTVYVDGFTLETDANSTTVYQDGEIALGGVISTPLTVQPVSNSANAFQVTSARGASVFNVDNTDANLLAGYAGFEVNSQGWSYTTTGGSISRDSSTALNGDYSLKIVTAATANNGARLSLNNSAALSPMATVAGSAPYVLSWYSRLDAASAAFTDMTAVYSPDGTATTACSSINTQTVIVGGWTRHICMLTTSATAQTSASYIAIRQTGATAHTFYIDGVQLEAGSVAGAYGAGAISFNATINTPVFIQNKTNSVSAFQIQNSASSNMFSVDTVNNRIQVGSVTTDTTMIGLQLDSDSDFAESESCSTTLNQGAMYYNTSTNAIRACVNAGWEDVMSTAGLGLIMFGVVPDSGTTSGDVAGVNATDASDGPCKVYMGSVVNSVRWTGCTLYAYGRKHVVTAQATDYTTGITATANAFQNLCIGAPGAQPTFLTASATETSTTMMTTPANWSIDRPSICLATIKQIATGGGIGNIYDTRVFTTSTKAAASINTLSNIGFAVKPNTTVGGAVPTAAATDPFMGVLVSYSGTISATVVNAVVVTSGQAYVKATTATTGLYIIPTTTPGYVASAALVTTARTDIPFNLLGMSQTSRNAPGTQCSVTANADTCRGSVLVNINVR